MTEARIVWPDLAKGLSIILVVYGHAVIGVNADVPLDPWLFDTVMKPFSQFRMPLFFFVTGLFAAKSVRRDWATFADRTLLHLVYVFLVWNVLQYGARFAFASYANHPIDTVRIFLFPFWPINITWFIWALLIYYVLVKLTARLPAALLVAPAAVLFAAPYEGYHYALTQTTQFFVFFALGHACSGFVLGLKRRPGWTAVVAGLVGYFALCLVATYQGFLVYPLVELVVRCLGVVAVLALCMRLAASGKAGFLVRLGGYTLPIFVMHTLVTAALREVLLRLGLVSHPAVLILLAAAAGIGVPLLFHQLMRRLGIPWLFERPAWFRLKAPARQDAPPIAAAPAPT